ncbi:MAG TPA: hypothetical protein VJ770_25555 [Stellaceae bacterium]|nr:hypothetical protein [Stellaceae bacterium]
MAKARRSWPQPSSGPSGRGIRSPVRAAILLALLFGLGALSRPAAALPLYARQTGLVCASCHTTFFQLTPFGRRFKLGGYTLGGGTSTLPPFAVMLQPTFTHTAAGQPGGAAPHFGPNNNFALQEASLFTGGRITDHIGAFIQGTYDGVDRRFGWDNTDIRYANAAKPGGHDLLLGVTLNNNPSVQDVWNTTPAWSFPFISPTLSPTPAASTFIEETFAQHVLGLGAYGFLDDSLYVELTGYRSLAKRTELLLGVDTTDDSPIDGIAPYWRVAVERNFGKNSLEIGTFGLEGHVRPLRMFAAGTDAFTDVGVDSQYQWIGDRQAVTFRISWIHEDHDLGASQALGLADRSHDTLRSFHTSLSYTFDDTWELTGARFSLSGTRDATLYGTTNGKPDTSGWIAEIAYLPYMHGGPKFWPWFNARLGLQYTRYDKFNGAGRNFDGMGRNAGDNNTILLYAWIMF